MILNVTIEQTDSIKAHQHWEEIFLASENGMIPVEFAGKFRFHPSFFEVEQQHKGRITKFKLHLVHQI